MKRILQRTAALWVACFALTGCALEDWEREETSRSAASVAGATQLRLVHASATSNPFDVYAGAATTPLFAAVSYGAATGYVTVPAGSVDLAFRPAGAPATASPVFSTVLAIGEGQSVTAVAAGLLGSIAEGNRFRVLSLVEGFDTPEPGRIRARLVQASHGLATAGFDLGDDGSIEVAALPAFAASDAAGLEIDCSRQGVQLAIHSGTPVAARHTAFTLPPELLIEGEELFLVLAGLPTFRPRETRGLALIAVSTGAAALVKQNPTLYFLPAIPDSSAVDAFAVGREIGLEQVADDAGFGALVPVQLPPTSAGYTVVLVGTNAGRQLPPFALGSTGPLAAGERYLALASGFLARAGGAEPRPRVALNLYRDGFATQLTAQGRFRGIAASPGAPAIDIGRFPPGEGTPFTVIPGLEGLAFGAASAELGAEVPTVPLNPGVRETGNATALRFGSGSLANTERAFGVGAGAWSPRAGEIGPSFILVRTPISGLWTSQLLGP